MERASELGRLNLICDAFEREWLEGRTPSIEELLGGIDESEQGRLLPELVALEMAYRRKRGERPSFDEFRDRFPQYAEVLTASFGSANTPGSRISGSTHVGPIEVPRARAAYRLV